MGSVWDFSYAGGTFEVAFLESGAFYCQDYLASRARWEGDLQAGGEVRIHWGRYGHYTLRAEPQGRAMRGCYTGRPADWRSAAWKQDLAAAEAQRCEAAVAAAAQAEIRVCHARSCRAAGSEAVFLEIEELAKIVGAGCAVKKSGCLGLCNSAPAAVVLQDTGEYDQHVRLRTLEDSAAVLVEAVGDGAAAPRLDDPQLEGGLRGLRVTRARQANRQVYKWNAALAGLAEQIAGAAGQPAQKRALQLEEAELLAAAGAGDEAWGRLRHLDSGSAVLAGFAKLLGKGASPRCCSKATPSRRIDHYSPWRLESVTPVSKHSAVFRFSSATSGSARGTPPRGGTWHTTLLAEVGEVSCKALPFCCTSTRIVPKTVRFLAVCLSFQERNREGPLPWIERDYTPVSSAEDWARGKCDILIKIYPDGLATSWLVQQPAGCQVMLSEPMLTLHVPTLMAEGRGFQPASVMLILGGTGVVALPQIMHHRDPSNKYISRGYSQPFSSVPIQLILSCRKDDVLMLREVTAWCQERRTGLRHCTLFVTDAVAPALAPPPFPDANGPELTELRDLPNARVVEGRLKLEFLHEIVPSMPRPCRTLVSGPAGFNTGVREMLAALGTATDTITILSA
jgi:ferredoxin-NADP reductase